MIVDGASISTEGLQKTPKPSSTIPFRRDPDFVDWEILTQVRKRYSKPVILEAWGESLAGSINAERVLNLLKGNLSLHHAPGIKCCVPCWRRLG